MTALNSALKWLYQTSTTSRNKNKFRTLWGLCTKSLGFFASGQIELITPTMQYWLWHNIKHYIDRLTCIFMLHDSY